MEWNSEGKAWDLGLGTWGLGLAGLGPSFGLSIRFTYIHTYILA